MASQPTEHVQASTPEPGRTVATGNGYVASGEACTGEGEQPGALAEGEGFDWYGAWLHVCAWAGVAALVLLASSLVYEARASEPARIWTPAEMGAWAAKLKGEKRTASWQDCVRGTVVDKACLQRLFFGYDLGGTGK